MDKWTTLEPIKLHGSGSSTPVPTKKLKAPPNPNLYARYIGPLPVDVHIIILYFIPISSFPSYARTSKSLGRLLYDERVWKWKCDFLRLGDSSVESLLSDIGHPGSSLQSAGAAGSPRLGGVSDQPRLGPPVLEVTEDDEFGDFASAPLATTLSTNGFNPGGGSSSLGSSAVGGAPFTNGQADSKPILRNQYIHAHRKLVYLSRRLLNTAPHLLLPSLFPVPEIGSPPSLNTQAQTLALLLRFLSPVLQPTLNWKELRVTLLSAVDRFQAATLASFESASSSIADAGTKEDERAMREATWASWEVWKEEQLAKYYAGGVAARARNRDSLVRSEWEIGRVWADKLEIFYENSDWDPSLNFKQNETLGFEAMDDFMNHIVDSLKKAGSQAVRIFPQDSQVLVAFADRLANDVVGEYITPVLTQARGIKNIEPFLQATAASFVQAWRVVPTLLEVAGVSVNSAVENPPASAKVATATRRMSLNLKPRDSSSEILTYAQAEDVIFKMFEPNMDEYLDEEIEHLKSVLEAACSEWDQQVTSSLNPNTPTTARAESRFLSSSNPAAVKRTVLASFTDLMLLPVTIVPRTVNTVGSAVGAMVTTGGNAAVNGIAMLNPARWAGSAGVSGAGTRASEKEREGYGQTSVEFKEKDTVVFKPLDDDGEDEDDLTVIEGVNDRSSVLTRDTERTRIASSNHGAHPKDSVSHASLSLSQSQSQSNTFDTLQLLLSLDTALTLIHANREALKRAETFSSYPGHYGHRVRETIEEIFVLLVQIMGSRHVVPGFEKAKDQMLAYDPTLINNEDTGGDGNDEAGEGGGETVAPLTQFFELVHIGDMIQSMVQVYFDKEVARHIDRTDFLNSAVREKKRFENALDESVASGLNAGTQVLMNQVEHILQVRTGPREYYPVDGSSLDLQPTRGCRGAIACLKTHCDLLKGSTSKEVLEVFHQEIGIRLAAIVQKHLKRQIISLEGGFQVIADLNAYHAFITSLKIPLIAQDFANLKMLGHVYIVEDATDLAQIVRDVTRYGNSFRPEDVYEFIQRRSDWKKIEKTVDKAMYNLSFKEDCVIC